MFPFYYEYANLLLKKLESSNELFPGQYQQNNKEGEDKGKKQAQNKQKDQKDNQGKDEEDEDKDENEDIGELQIVWETLEIAIQIVEKELEDSNTTLDPFKLKKYKYKLSQAYQRQGDAECLKDSHSEAIHCYNESLRLINEIYADDFARRKAELLFLIGTTMIYAK